jgi:hypothetical protein
LEIPVHIKGNEMIGNALFFANVILLSYEFSVLDQLTGGAQAEPRAPIEIELEMVWTRGVWSALPDGVAGKAGQKYRPAQQEQGKRRIRGRAKGATATTKGIRRSA